MSVVNCQSIRTEILSHLTKLTRTEQLRDLCVATLPIRTLDGRLTDVFIEHRLGDYVVVNDAGKAANELILNGVNITPSIANNCEQIAARFGVVWSDEMFQTDCKVEDVSSAALSVAMCSSLAMVYLLDHVAAPEQETASEQFSAALKTWGRNRARIKTDVRVEGGLKQHSFDFVAYPKRNAEPITISILSPSGNALSTAERFGFKAKDLEGTQFARWRKVAVETRVETWSGPARNLVAKCSDAVIELKSEDKPTPAAIARSLNALLVA